MPKTLHKVYTTDPKYRAIFDRLATETPEQRAARVAENGGKPNQAKLPITGPGTELKDILVEFGYEECVSCALRVGQMNSWGIEGCKEHRTEIIGWLVEEAAKRSWAEWLAAKAASGWLVDEAIRRAEMKQRSEALEGKVL